MTIDFSLREPNEPVSSETISQLETTLGIHVPEDYRSFLITCNGGVANIEKSQIYYFHPVNRVPGESTGIPHFFSAQNVICEDGIGIMPKKCLVIAENMGGHPIVLSCRDEDYGSVYLCDLNVYNDDGNFTVNLGGSFSEFYQALVPTPPLDELMRDG